MSEPRITAEHVRLAARQVYVTQGLAQATTRELWRELLRRLVGAR
jgi:hypothetical protein